MRKNRKGSYEEWEKSHWEEEGDMRNGGKQRTPKAVVDDSIVAYHLHCYFIMMK